MKKNLLLLLLLSLTAMPALFAQHNCGVSKQAGELIKQRLLENRSKYSKQEVTDLLTNRTITYIPVSIHSVSNSAGEGAATERQIFDFLCGLNALYLNQDVQFFIHNQIHFRTSNNIDDDAGSNASSSEMNGWSVANTLNITIGRSQNNPTSSWYSPWGDYIFLLKQMMSPQAKTEAHEVGHFFTLPHTFVGWEGISAEADYGGQNVPFTIGSGWSGFSPERVARTGSQANCSSAADAFCDTEADYYSSRTACPYNVTAKDPYGNSLDPDESNIMSYALDACITTFSNEQKAAMAMDIAGRNWVTNTPGGTVHLENEPPVAPISPVNNGQLGDINNATVLLDWTPINGATWYYLEVVGTIFPNIWAPNATDIIYRDYIYTGDSHYNLSTAMLQAGKRYAWRVTPISNYSTCALPSSYYKFEAVTNVTTAIDDLPIEKQMTLSINSNPISTSYIPVSIYTAEDVIGSIRLYGTDGREVLSLSKQTLSAGESIIQLPAEDLANGLYLAVFSTERGLLQQKVLIQR